MPPLASEARRQLEKVCTEARELAAQYRRIARDGGDPLQERRKARRVVPTFGAAARQAVAA